MTMIEQALDAALVVAGSLVVALFAQLSLRLLFTPVPVSGQTFAVLAIATALGPAGLFPLLWRLFGPPLRP